MKINNIFKISPILGIVCLILSPGYSWAQGAQHQVIQDSIIQFKNRLAEIEVQLEKVTAQENWNQDPDLTLRVSNLNNRKDGFEKGLERLEYRLSESARTAPLVMTHVPQPILTHIWPDNLLPGQRVKFDLMGDHLNNRVTIKDQEGAIDFFNYQVEHRYKMTVEAQIPEDINPGPRSIIPLYNNETMRDRLAINISPPSPPEPSFPRPRITGVEPAQFEQGSGSKRMVIVGRGFVRESEILLSIKGVSIDNMVVNEPSGITLSLIIGPAAEVGPKPFYVVNPGDKNISNEAVIEITPRLIEDKRPVIASVYPSRIVARDGEVQLQVHGENFTPQTEILLNIPFTRIDQPQTISDLLLTLNVTTSYRTPVGDFEIRAVNPGDLISPEPLFIEIIEDSSPDTSIQVDTVTIVETTYVETPPDTAGIGGTHTYPDNGAESDNTLFHIIWGAGALLLSSLMFAWGRIKSGKLKLSWENEALVEWELEAKTDLPEPEEVCRWACQIEADRKMGDWEIASIVIEPMTVGDGNDIPARRFEEKEISDLNELNKATQIVQGDEKTKEHLQQTVRNITDVISQWVEAGRSPASVKLSAELKTGITGKFHLHHCEQGKEGPEWVKKKTWDKKAKRTEIKELCIIRGSKTDEPGLVEKSRDEIETALMKLVKKMRYTP